MASGGHCFSASWWQHLILRLCVPRESGEAKSA